MFVSIAVPTLNEEIYISECLTSLLDQWPNDLLEILVVDGGSSDRTVELVNALSQHHPCISVVHNPKRLQSAAMNHAAAVADPRATILFRADAHAKYPRQFVRECLKAFQDSTVTSVVVPMKTVGEGRLQRAIAAAQNSRLGNGGSAHRIGGVSGFVEHGHHAAFERAFFLRLGGYDEGFSHNEDAEFDFRALRAGGRIWMCAEATITYFPKRRLGLLAKQYFRHGQGRARTVLTHRMRPRPRQLAPLLIFFGVFEELLVVSVFWGFAVLPIAYLLLCTGWGLARSIVARDPWLLAIGPAAIIMHLSWAFGFLDGVTNWYQSGPFEPQLGGFEGTTFVGSSSTAAVPDRGLPYPTHAD
jgi:succinoglycan biosynthesis protein ExoA